MVMRRSRRPKYSAEPTTSGTTPSAVSVSRGCIRVSRTTPPTSARIWRENSAIWWLSTPCSRPMSVVSRLVSSPVRRSAKKPGRHLQQLGKQLPPEPGDHPLAHGAQQIGLGVVQHAPGC